MSRATARAMDQSGDQTADQIVVEPGGPLAGTIVAGGAKNSALKLMVACLLAEGRSVLSNVPYISDVDTMAKVLRAMGAQVERLDGEGTDGGELAVISPPWSELRPPICASSRHRLQPSTFSTD